MPILLLLSHNHVILNLCACNKKQIFTQCTELHKYLHRVFDFPNREPKSKPCTELHKYLHSYHSNEAFLFSSLVLPTFWDYSP
jgi:hypothetical protein